MGQAKYSEGLPPLLRANAWHATLPFLYQSTGVETFFTGVCNPGSRLAVSSLIPAVAELLGLAAPDSRFYVWLPGILIIYLGIVLILASRNLYERASLVFWEGILRLAGFVVATRYGFFGQFGVSLGMVGVIDLLVGLVCIIGLPIALNRSMIALLLDRKE